MFKIGILSQTSAPVPPPPITANWSDIASNDDTVLYSYTYQQVTGVPVGGVTFTIFYDDSLIKLFGGTDPAGFFGGTSQIPPSTNPNPLLPGITWGFIPNGGLYGTIFNNDYITFAGQLIGVPPGTTASTVVSIYDGATLVDQFTITATSVSADITPNSVNWSDITFDPTTNPSITRQYTTQQITGINTPIELSISSSSAEVSTLWYRVSPVAPPTFSSSLILFDNNAEGFVRWVPGVNITVGNGSYITFTANGPSLGLSTTVFEVRNVSDNNTILDSFTATTLSKTNFSGVNWTSVSSEFPAYTGQGFKKTFTSQTIPANQLGTSGASVTVKNTDLSNANIYYSITAVGPFADFLDVTTDPNWTLVPFGATGSTFTVFNGTTVSFTVVPAVNAVTSGQFYIYNNSIGGTLIDTVQVSLIQGPDYIPNAVSWGSASTNNTSNFWTYTSSAQITGINQPITVSYVVSNSNPVAFSGISLNVWYAITATPLVAGVDYNPNVVAGSNAPPFVQYTAPITVTNGQYITWYYQWTTYPALSTSSGTFTFATLNNSNNFITIGTHTTTFIPTGSNITTSASFANINHSQGVTYLNPTWLYSTNLLTGVAGQSSTFRINYTAPSYVQLYYRLSATSTLPTTTTNPTAASPAFVAINDGATILVTVGQNLQFAVSYTSTTGQVINYVGYNVSIVNIGVLGNPSVGSFVAKVFPDGSTPISAGGANRLTIVGYPNELGTGVTGYKRTASDFGISSSLTSFNYRPLLTATYTPPAGLNLYYRFYTGAAPSPAFDPFLDPATVPYYTLLQPGTFSYNSVTGELLTTNTLNVPFATSAEIGGTGVLRLEVVPSATSNPPTAVTSTPINFSIFCNIPTTGGSSSSSNVGTTGTNSLTDNVPNALDFNNITIGNQADGKYGFTQVLQIKDINTIALFSITSYTSLAGFTVFVKYSLTPFTITNSTHPGNQGFVRIAAQNLTATSSMITPTTTYPAFTFPSNTPVTTNVTNGMYIAIAIVQDTALSGSTTLTINNEYTVGVIDTFSVAWNTAFAGSNPNPGTTSFNNPTNTF